MSNADIQKTEVVALKDTNIVEKVCCFAWFFAQVIVAVFFLLGFCQVNGQTVGVLTFLNNVIDIFSLQFSMFYYYASSCAQGVLYLVFLVLLIIKFIQSITYWTNSTCRKTILEENFKATFKLLIQYIFLSAALNQVRFTSYATIALILIFTFFIVLSGLKALISPRRPTALYLISRFGYAIIVCILVGGIGVLLCRNSIENIWKGMGLLFGYLKGTSGETIIQILYTYIVKDAFYLVMIFIFFKILQELELGKTVLGIDDWKALLTVSAVFVCIDLIVYFTFTGTVGNDVLGAIIDQLKTQSEILSILFFSIAGVLTGSYPIIKRYAPVKERAVVTDTEEELEEDKQPALQTVETPASQPVMAKTAEQVDAATSAQEQPASDGKTE